MSATAANKMLAIPGVAKIIAREEAREKRVESNYRKAREVTREISASLGYDQLPAYDENDLQPNHCRCWQGCRC